MPVKGLPVHCLFNLNHVRRQRLTLLRQQLKSPYYPQRLFLVQVVLILYILAERINSIAQVLNHVSFNEISDSHESVCDHQLLYFCLGL